MSAPTNLNPVTGQNDTNTPEILHDTDNPLTIPSDLDEEELMDPETGMIIDKGLAQKRPWGNSSDTPQARPKKNPKNTGNLGGSGPTPPPRNYIVIPDSNAYKIYGITRQDYFYLVGKQSTLPRWDEEIGQKILAHLPGDKFRKDPTFTVKTIKAIATLITGNSKLEVLPAIPDSLKFADDALYNPALITNISYIDRERLLASTIFSTPKGTLVTMEYNYPPSDFIMQLGQTNLTNTLSHLEQITDELRHFMEKPGSAPFRILETIFDNVPVMFKDVRARAFYIGSTIRIVPIEMGVKDSDEPRTLFNIHMRSPTTDHKRHQQWVSAFTRKDRYVPSAGPLYVMNPYQCVHCSGRSHPSGLCQFTRLPGFTDTIFPVAHDTDTQQGQLGQPATQGRKGGNGPREGRTGRGRGRAAGRGRR